MTHILPGHPLAASKFTSADRDQHRSVLRQLISLKHPFCVHRNLDNNIYSLGKFPKK